MVTLLCTLATVAIAPVEGLPTAIWQIRPEVNPQLFKGDGKTLKTQDRAVVLIHGLQFHPIRTSKVVNPDHYDWVRARSELVQVLESDADVYGFAYAQTIGVDGIPLAPGLSQLIQALQNEDYKEIVLVGHSAGGIIARQFVECFPEAGVTKVIQVASPNTGSDLARLARVLPPTQVPFIQSLSPRVRQDFAALRSQTIPDQVQFCCVVCKVPRLPGDTIVRLDSQWSPDLQDQGIPAVLIAATHLEAMRAPHAVQRIAQLTRERIIRWDEKQVTTARTIIFGKEADLAAERKVQEPTKAATPTRKP